MPKELHDALARETDRKGLKGKHRDAYIYGTLYKIEHRNKMAKALTAKKEAKGRH